MAYNHPESSGCSNSTDQCSLGLYPTPAMVDEATKAPLYAGYWETAAASRAYVVSTSERSAERHKGATVDSRPSNKALLRLHLTTAAKA